MSYGDQIVLGDGIVMVDGVPYSGSSTCNRDLMRQTEEEVTRRDYADLARQMLADGLKLCLSPYHGRDVLPDDDGWMPMGQFGADVRNRDGKKTWCRQCCAYHEELRRIKTAADEGRQLRPRRSSVNFEEWGEE